MKQFAANEILKVMKKKGYRVFEKGSTNLIGVRSNNSRPNFFDDSLYDLRLGNETVLKHYQVTTDPGTTSLVKPVNSAGCAILKPGQYRGMWAVGKHKGKYSALVQVGECRVIRDADRDNELDFDAKKEETGLFGINCHKARDGTISTLVNGWSAGCQVHADANRFDNEFMPDMRKAAAKYGNSFTYTLLTESDFIK
jgi:hypothetical protein